MTNGYTESTDEYSHSAIVITGLFDPESYLDDEVWDFFDTDLIDIFLYCITQTLLLDLSIKSDRIKSLRLNSIREKLFKFKENLNNNS
ncbi:hypothetical protein Lepto7375DRAFT_7238 [Leptolyngbya sp. PCC 7375]|nr:hypothetical protein Lepto7375DRAFT_7238 [Leptolyngbya sp. PCC 7375]